jgi:lysophospholipase L1-like esterase
MKKVICLLLIISLGIQGGNIMARTKLLTDAVYSPTIAASEEAIRTQIDDSIQEVLDLALEDVTINRKLSPTGDFTGTINGGDVTLTEPGLSGAFNAHKADSTTAHGIDKFVGITPNPSYESIYNFARVNDLNVIAFGDSIMQGYALPNSDGIDGELQYLGVKSFANTFYLDLMKKTADLVPATLSDVTITGTIGTVAQMSIAAPSALKYYINDCVIISNTYNQSGDRVLKVANYYGKNITIWGIKNNLPEATKCDVYIDGVKVGEIDEKSLVAPTPRDYFTPYTFTVAEGQHTIELKNFVNTGGASSDSWRFYFCGISNRKHMFYNESYGAQGTNWALQNISRVLTKTPDITFLGFGANDCGLPVEDPQHAEPALFYSNYMEIIKQIQDAFPSCKLSIMTSVPDSNAGAADWESDYMPLVYKIARAKNCRIIESWNTLDAINPATWRIDNIHPNEYGHGVIKELYEKAWCPEVLVNTVAETTSSDTITYKLAYPSVADIVYGACVYIKEDGTYAAPSDATTLANTIGSVLTKSNSIPTTQLAKLSTHGVGFCLVASDTVVALNDRLIPSVGGYWVVDNTFDISTGIFAIAIEAKAAGSLGQIRVIIQNNR